MCSPLSIHIIEVKTTLEFLHSICQKIERLDSIYSEINGSGEKDWIIFCSKLSNAAGKLLQSKVPLQIATQSL